MQAFPFSQVGTKGLFIKEIEEALVDGRIDLAVHSLKDLPTELLPSLSIAAILRRADPRDAIVSLHYDFLESLPAGIRVGTSSRRRKAKLRLLRPDLDLVYLRGNVDTRLKKLESGEVNAVVLASAGLDRLGAAEWVHHRFSTRRMCPAAGQGAFGVEIRMDDWDVREAVRFLDHAPTGFAVRVERAALSALGGGCQVPVGLFCEGSSDNAPAFGVVSDPEGGRSVQHEIALSEGLEAVELGLSFASGLIEQGAQTILDTL